MDTTASVATRIVDGILLRNALYVRYIKPKIMLIATLFPVAMAISGYGLSSTLFQFDFCGCFMSFFLGLHVCSNGIMMGYYSTEDTVNKNSGKKIEPAGGSTPSDDFIFSDFQTRDI